jgi:hypothetical protein
MALASRLKVSSQRQLHSRTVALAARAGRCEESVKIGANFLFSNSPVLRGAIRAHSGRTPHGGNVQTLVPRLDPGDGRACVIGATCCVAYSIVKVASAANCAIDSFKPLAPERAESPDRSL